MEAWGRTARDGTLRMCESPEGVCARFTGCAHRPPGWWAPLLVSICQPKASADLPPSVRPLPPGIRNLKMRCFMAARVLKCLPCQVCAQPLPRLCVHAARSYAAALCVLARLRGYASHGCLSPWSSDRPPAQPPWAGRHRPPLAQGQEPTSPVRPPALPRHFGWQEVP
jgi:hypothetical protein